MGLPRRISRLGEADIDRRAPVWAALSNLFLDTELQPTQHSWIAHVIAEAGFGVDEAEGILVQEVLPVFGHNLLSIAGEWTFWPDDYVRERILDPEAWPGPFAGRIMMRLFRLRKSILEGDWRKIRAQLV